MSTRKEFRNEMAAMCIKRYSLNQASLQAVSRWHDWDELYDAGYRTVNSGEALQEWLRCS